MNWRVFINRRIPDAGIEYLRDAGLDVDIYPHDQAIPRSDLLNIIDKYNALLTVLTDQIDEQIAEIERLIPKYVARGIELKDLNNQRSRLLKLRNNLGDILSRLKESLCLDIRGEKFDESVRKLISEIT